MGFNVTPDKQTAPLDTIAGLVSISGPPDLPEGASPRNHDIDYDIGGVFTRAGQTSVYIYDNAPVGPNNAASAVDVNLGGVAWTNPTGILSNDASYASITLGGSGNQTFSPSSGTNASTTNPWVNPSNIFSASSFATVSLTLTGNTPTPPPTPPPAPPYPPKPPHGCFSGNVRFKTAEGWQSFESSPESLYIENQTGTHKANLEVHENWSGPMVDFGGGWLVTLDHLMSAGAGRWEYAKDYFGDAKIVQYTGTVYNLHVETDSEDDRHYILETGDVAHNEKPIIDPEESGALLAAQIPFNIPANATVVGIAVTMNALATGTASPSIGVQLMQGGTAVGNTLSFTPTTSATSYTLGSSSNVWGTSWTPAQINNSNFGCSIVATSSGNSGQANAYGLNRCSFQVYYTLPTTGDALNVTQYGFSLPSTTGVTGIVVTLSGYATSSGGGESGQVNVQLLKGGVPVGTAKSFTQTGSAATVSLGSAADTWGASFSYADVNSETFGIQATVNGTLTQLLNYSTIRIYESGSLENYMYAKTYKQENGVIQTIALDAAGTWFVENVNTNPDVLTVLNQLTLPDTWAQSATAFNKEYICLSNLTQGTDIPRQYTPQGNWDRISQVGPGAPPSVSVSNTTFAIVASPNGVTQPAAVPIPTTAGGYPHNGFFLCSTGPDSSQAGSIYTYYFVVSQASLLPKVGQYVYFAGAPNTDGVNFNGTFLVVAVNPQDATHTDFCTVSVAGTANTYLDIQANSGTSATMQITQATVNTTVPVPNLSSGVPFTLAGVAVSNWNNTWTCNGLVNGAQMFITDTQLSGGLATYTYTLQSGVAPTVSQNVTVFGSTNGGGIFNVSNASIISVGTNTFSINLAGANVAAGADTGSAFVNATEFTFDPGPLAVGTTNNPIYGNSGGGTLSISGTLTSGTRQAVVMFWTRNGFLTECSPPVTFTTTTDTGALVFTNVPTGPPNVTARYIAITEAGQNGVSGASFYIVPNAVKLNVAGVTTVYDATIINDNVTTSASFTLSDAVLLNAEEIDVQGQNQFDVIELGSCGWVVPYQGRNYYGLEQNKVQNLLNTTFDGGQQAAQTVGSNQVAAIVPCGWNVANQSPYYGALNVSPTFGNSFYVSNTTGSTVVDSTVLWQSAYQDAYGGAIIAPGVTYSVRMTCRVPSGIVTEGGSAVVDIFSPSLNATFGEFVVPYSSLTTNMQIITGDLLTTTFAAPILTDLQLRFYQQEMVNGGDFECDRFEVFPTLQPINAAEVRVSYADENPEACDLITGNMGLAQQNNQPVYGAAVVYGNIYFLKESSMFTSQDNPNTEPVQFGVSEVSNQVGACGIHAYDSGEEWLVTACRKGVYIFSGGPPTLISGEIWNIWEQIYWPMGHTICVRNDIINKRILVGVPLKTPNFWLPNPTYGAQPTPQYTNVVLMCSYKGLDSVGDLQSEPQDHVSIMGSLTALDMRRKWTLWQIETPYFDFITRQDGLSAPLFICNGVGTSKIYQLIDGNYSDDGTAINSLYTTYGFVNQEKAKEYPLLGFFRKMFSYLRVLASGNGRLQVKAYLNKLTQATTGKGIYQIPNGLPLQDDEYDFERPLNVSGNRVYLEYSTNVAGEGFQLSNMSLVGKQHPHLPIKGPASR